MAKVIDLKRVLTLSDYHAEIHGKKNDAPGLYLRRIRDLIGHGECIMGIIDSNPAKFAFIDAPLPGKKAAGIVLNEPRRLSYI